MDKIAYTKPSITDREVDYAIDAARNGWGERCYEYIGKFEEAFRVHLGAKHAIATSSCTGALHMGLSALGIGPGDEVLLGDINWIASAAPITYLGAKPVLVDVKPDTWCIDPDKVEQALTSRTKAIIAVHVYGNLCELDRLLEIGNKYNIPIVEDSAEAIGSMFHGKRAGTVGRFGTFSFHGTKTMTTGEGGMFVTNDTALYETVLTLSNHGRASSQVKQFWPDVIGYKYKMSNIQAAIGLAQVERLDSLIAKKRAIFHAYKDRLSQLPLSMNPEPPGTINGYWMPTVVIDKNILFDREELITRFSKQNIDARVFFWPLSMLPFMHDHKQNTIARSLYSRAMNLPSHHDLTFEDIDRVCDVLIASLMHSKEKSGSNR